KGMDISGKLVYNVTKFDTANHGGSTKKEILSDTSQPFPGFRIQLLQEDLTIPRSGSGTTTKDRPNLEAGKTPNDYLALTQDPSSPYYKEHGLTPEDWLSLFSTTLHETGIAIDNYADGKNTAAYLTGSYNSASGFVLLAYWDRGFEQADLDGNDSTGVVAHDGVRVAVG
ncbi:MAG: hypothetical protein NT003_04255, partial [Candidatus Magasanikbacteria bacterium]|nr:hypothetical protein [Candidatus Magasanikbacteria bacterium]